MLNVLEKEPLGQFVVLQLKLLIKQSMQLFQQSKAKRLNLQSVILT